VFIFGTKLWPRDGGEGCLRAATADGRTHTPVTLPYIVACQWSYTAASLYIKFNVSRYGHGVL
jgi:hypothetical protein